MNFLFRYWKQLKRRNLPKSVVSYVVFSWAILQILNVLSSLAIIPKSVGRVIFIMLLCLLPFWILFSWFYNVTPDGIRRVTKNPSEIDAEHTVSVGKRLNVFIMVFLTLAVILLVVDRFRLTSKHASEVQLAVSEEINSIAVLPFSDMSLKQDQRYFADGLAEELITSLSKITNIKVTSRRSAFSFRDKIVDIPTIAKQLGVNYLLEGSVRKYDSILRVSVQLIDTELDSNAWSQTWDKKLENIFSIQNEISTIVAQKLALKISGSEIPEVTKIDPEAYQLYLQARYEFNSTPGVAGTQKALEYVLNSIKIDSVYAPSWELLSYIYHAQSNYGNITMEEGYRLAKEAALRALKIDSTHVNTNDILATIAIDYERDYKKAKKLVEKGLSSEPNNPSLMDRAAEIALFFGDPEEALKYRKRLVELNPLDESTFFGLGSTFYFSNQYAEAEKALKKSLQLDTNPQVTYHLLSSSLLFQNKLQEALEYALKEPIDGLRLHSLAMIYNALGDEDKATAALQELIQGYEESFSYQIACTYAMMKDKEETFNWLDKAIYYKDFGLIECEIEPSLNYVKDDSRWPKFISKIGFLSNPELVVKAEK